MTRISKTVLNYRAVVAGVSHKFSRPENSGRLSVIIHKLKLRLIDRFKLVFSDSA